MRIAIIFPHLAAEEEERNTYNISIRERYLSKRLNESGHEAFLCYLTHGSSPFTLDNGPETAHFFPLNEECRNKSRRLYISDLLGRALRDFMPDVTVFKGMGYILPWWLCQKKYLSGATAFVIGGNPSDILVPRVSYVFTEYVSQLKGRYASLFYQNRAALLGKYVPNSDFGIADNKEFDIISIGSVTRRKNHRALIPLFDRYRIVIIGDGPELPVLKKAAEGCGNVTFTGAVSKEHVGGYLKKALIMVHPSKNEGFPRVFAEAFAAGVPVVALKRAIKGDFPHNIAGVLVKEPDLEHAVISLLGNKKKVREYAENAFRIAENSYRGEVVFEQFMKGLERAAEEKSLSPVRLFFLRSILLPMRYVFWRLDHYFYNRARRIKRKVFRFILGRE